MSFFIGHPPFRGMIPAAMRCAPASGCLVDDMRRNQREGDTIARGE